MNRPLFEDDPMPGETPEPNPRPSPLEEFDDEYSKPAPVGLVRILGVVVLLHLIAVAGVIGFRQLGKDKPDAPEPVAMETKSVEQPKPKENEILYQVRSGDTLPSIARFFEASVAQLQSINDLKAGQELKPGQYLIIPREEKAPKSNEAIAKVTPKPETTPETKPLVPNSFPVEEPETIEEPEVLPTSRPEEVVAMQPTTQAEPEDPAVLRAKPITDPTQINGYQEPVDDGKPTEFPYGYRPPEETSDPVVAEVTMPEPQPAPVTIEEPEIERPDPVEWIPVENLPRAIPYDPRKDPQPTSRNPGMRTYVVRSGDTPYSIAQKFGVKWRDIMRANGIRDPRELRAGSEIRIP